MITVLGAPPFATVQDLGRPGHRASAVPPSGALDPAALIRANRIVGNADGFAGIEWGIGAGRLRLAPGTEIAIAGADVVVRRHADELTIESFRSGAWAYLAVQGGVDVPEILGSRSTFLPGGFGGHEGRVLRTGDVLPVGVRRPVSEAPQGPLLVAATEPSAAIAILPGPDRALMDDRIWDEFLAADWTVSRSVSRAGYRLDGPVLPFRPPPDLPSAPVCPGTVQLPPGGRPIVLMPDGPTVGGYLRIAVVVSAELGRLAQRRPGEPVRFVPP